MQSLFVLLTLLVEKTDLGEYQPVWYKFLRNWRSNGPLRKNDYSCYQGFPKAALHKYKEELLFSIYWYAQVIELSGSVDNQAMIAIAKIINCKFFKNFFLQLFLGASLKSSDFYWPEPVSGPKGYYWVVLLRAIRAKVSAHITKYKKLFFYLHNFRRTDDI